MKTETGKDIKKYNSDMMEESVEIEEIRHDKDIDTPPPGPRRPPRGKICYGDCFACSIQQAVYCASTHARMTMRMVEEMVKEYDEIMEAIGCLTEEITDIKKLLSPPEELINPLEIEN